MSIQSKPPTEEYKQGWDRIFGKKRRGSDKGGFDAPFVRNEGTPNYEKLRNGKDRRKS